MLAVTYNRASVSANLRQIAGRESASGATFVQSFDFPQQNITTRTLAVPTAKVAQAEALLRQQAGVQKIGLTGERRYHATSVAQTTNDPYFVGFGQPGPYHETASSPGQWDMWAIGLANAYGYSQNTNSLNVGFPRAVGLSSVKIAIIDTGEDANHPELNSKLPYQKCFITNAANVQSIGNFSTDEDGHGTDVSGIAAAYSGNALGFTGAGGNSVIYGYRVFPTPDDNCANEMTTDQACSSSTTDIASAIMDAIAQNVNVISMSLGGGGCDMSGNDTDPVEGQAIAAAIAAKIVVVAASGNNGPTPVAVTAPGCDTGVIAAGATSLDDGTPTGTSQANGYSSTLTSTATAANPVEYVAYYSQYGTATGVHSSSAWGIVAPGGDPSSIDISGTADDLHWIENIWTTTPFGGQSDTNFAGECTPDFGTTSQNDCRTLIAGTSMATPHVAGAAALIIAATGGLTSSYQSPTAMKALLCATADDISDSHQGCGRLNVYNAMGLALNDPARATPIP
jgi:subtilisin family serine protease